MWTPWGSGEVSCIEGCPYFRDKFTLRMHVWDTMECSSYRGVLISGVSFKRSFTVLAFISVTVSGQVTHHVHCVALMFHPQAII